MKETLAWSVVLLLLVVAAFWMLVVTAVEGLAVVPVTFGAVLFGCGIVVGPCLERAALDYRRKAREKKPDDSRSS